MKKSIGLVGWNVGENSFGATKAYMEYLSIFGNVLILPPSHQTFDLDLLVLPGGQDMMSSKYGQVPSFVNTNPDLMKEFFFENNLKNYIEKETPIFGICLGAQMLNVFFEGHLDQNCGHPYSEERTDLAHPITINPMYKNWVEKGEYKVNSLHHQGIPEDGLGEDLISVATYTKHGNTIIEAFKHKQLDIWGVQWHPEEIYDTLSTKILSTLIKEKVG